MADAKQLTAADVRQIVRDELAKHGTGELLASDGKAIAHHAAIVNAASADGDPMDAPDVAVSLHELRLFREAQPDVDPESSPANWSRKERETYKPKGVA